MKLKKTIALVLGTMCVLSCAGCSSEQIEEKVTGYVNQVGDMAGDENYSTYSHVYDMYKQVCKQKILDSPVQDFQVFNTSLVTEQGEVSGATKYLVKSYVDTENAVGGSVRVYIDMNIIWETGEKNFQWEVIRFE